MVKFLLLLLPISILAQMPRYTFQRQLASANTLATNTISCKEYVADNVVTYPSPWILRKATTYSLITRSLPYPQTNPLYPDLSLYFAKLNYNLFVPVQVNDINHGTSGLAVEANCGFTGNQEIFHPQSSVVWFEAYTSGDRTIIRYLFSGWLNVANFWTPGDLNHREYGWFPPTTPDQWASTGIQGYDNGAYSWPASYKPATHIFDRIFFRGIYPQPAGTSGGTLRFGAANFDNIKMAMRLGNFPTIPYYKDFSYAKFDINKYPSPTQIGDSTISGTTGNDDYYRNICSHNSMVEYHRGNCLEAEYIIDSALALGLFKPGTIGNFSINYRDYIYYKGDPKYSINDQRFGFASQLLTSPTSVVRRFFGYLQLTNDNIGYLPISWFRSQEALQKAGADQPPYNLQVNQPFVASSELPVLSYPEGYGATIMAKGSKIYTLDYLNTLTNDELATLQLPWQTQQLTQDDFDTWSQTGYDWAMGRAANVDGDAPPMPPDYINNLTYSAYRMCPDMFQYFALYKSCVDKERLDENSDPKPKEASFTDIRSVIAARMVDLDGMEDYTAYKPNGAIDFSGSEEPEPGKQYSLSTLQRLNPLQRDRADVADENATFFLKMGFARFRLKECLLCPAYGKLGDTSQANIDYEFGLSTGGTDGEITTELRMFERLYTGDIGGDIDTPWVNPTTNNGMYVDLFDANGKYASSPMNKLLIWKVAPTKDSVQLRHVYPNIFARAAFIPWWWHQGLLNLRWNPMWTETIQPQWWEAHLDVSSPVKNYIQNLSKLYQTVSTIKDLTRFDGFGFNWIENENGMTSSFYLGNAMRLVDGSKFKTQVGIDDWNTSMPRNSGGLTILAYIQGNSWNLYKNTIAQDPTGGQNTKVYLGDINSGGSRSVNFKSFIQGGTQHQLTLGHALFSEGSWGVTGTQSYRHYMHFIMQQYPIVLEDAWGYKSTIGVVNIMAPIWWDSKENGWAGPNQGDLSQSFGAPSPDWTIPGTGNQFVGIQSTNYSDEIDTYDPKSAEYLTDKLKPEERDKLTWHEKMEGFEEIGKKIAASEGLDMLMHVIYKYRKDFYEVSRRYGLESMASKLATTCRAIYRGYREYRTVMDQVREVRDASRRLKQNYKMLTSSYKNIWKYYDNLNYDKLSASNITKLLPMHLFMRADLAMWVTTNNLHTVAKGTYVLTRKFESQMESAFPGSTRFHFKRVMQDHLSQVAEGNSTSNDSLTIKKMQDAGNTQSGFDSTKAWKVSNLTEMAAEDIHGTGIWLYNGYTQGMNLALMQTESDWRAWGSLKDRSRWQLRTLGSMVAGNQGPQGSSSLTDLTGRLAATIYTPYPFEPDTKFPIRNTWATGASSIATCGTDALGRAIPCYKR